MIGFDLRDLVADLVKNCKSEQESRKLCLPIDKPLPCFKKANCMFGVLSCGMSQLIHKDDRVLFVRVQLWIVVI